MNAPFIPPYSQMRAKRVANPLLSPCSAPVATEPLPLPCSSVATGVQSSPAAAEQAFSLPQSVRPSNPSPLHTAPGIRCCSRPAPAKVRYRKCVFCHNKSSYFIIYFIILINRHKYVYREKMSSQIPSL